MRTTGWALLAALLAGLPFFAGDFYVNLASQILIAAVFAELKAANPDGIRYLSLRLDDNTFIHVVETAGDDSGDLTRLPAFQAFQSGIRERCAEPPLVRAVGIVGNYRMLGEP